MRILRFKWLICLYLFMSLVRNASFLIVKTVVSGKKVSDVNRSLCKNILFVSLRLCTSPLVRAPPQLTHFTSPTTPSTPWHMRGRQFSTLETSSQESIKHKLRLRLHFALPRGRTPPFQRRRGYQWDSQYGSEAEIGRVDDILLREEGIAVGQVSGTVLVFVCYAC